MKRNHLSTVSAASRSSVTTILLLALFALLAAATANAATITWSNASGGAWSNAANWSPATVPGSADVAVLPALSGAYTVTLDVNPSASQISVASGDPTLDMNGKSITSVGTVENSGTIVNFAGPYGASQMHNHTGGSVIGASDGVITMAGGDIIVNDGRIVVGPGSSSQLYSNGIVTINGSGTLQLDHTNVIDAAGPAQNGGWIKIGADQTLSGTAKIAKRIYNYGTWVVDDTTATLDVIALTYNRGTLRIANNAHMHISGGLNSEGPGVISTGAGGGTLDMEYVDGGVRNGVFGTIRMLRGGTMVIDGGGDLNLHNGALYGGAIHRNGDTGVLSMDMGSLQQVGIDSGAEVLWTGWENQELSEHVRVDGLLRIAGQFECGLADTTEKDTTWFSGSGAIQLEGGIIGTGETGRLLVNEITITGHGTINPPFVNQGTVDLDGAQLTRPGPFVNGGRMKIGGGGLVVSGANTVFTNVGDLQIVGGSRIEKGAGIDNRGGVITTQRYTLSLGTSSSTGTIRGGRLESTSNGSFVVPRGGTLRDVTLGKTGVLQVGTNATAIAAGSRFTNLGTVQVAANGRLSTDGTTQYLQTDGATALAGGTLLSARDVQIQAGALRGFGVVSANLVNRGTVAPDANANALRIAGSYTQLAGGALQISLGGTAASQTSHFAVDGTATLAGSLSPVLVGGYLPTSGTSFPVFTYGTLSGGFDPLAAAVSGSNVGAQFTPFFKDGAMTLVMGGTTAVGDQPTAIGTLRFFGRTTATGTSFVLEQPYAAALKGRLYDAAGREVATLGDGLLPAGIHTFAMNRAGGQNLASGVYFARMSVAHDGVNEVRIARAVVLR